ncbi:MAG TPA: helix-turn-helix domain-containing GNAT family N-acetyltransferase [Thermoanaerobaculia bacterium]|jgi:DNA-binding MarR family transcriptional regulator/N-acetylglutamate synthase-like GNAT family acetyltransferase|nr:helix-turn-helix domain-containing GNAT family N-acetyltransferase [Thermoanaerobaculia bacterium]
MNAEYISQVRRFNRLVTQRAGALDDHFLGRDRPLGESRLLFEIGPRGGDLRELRSRLGLDSGYLSRLAQSLVSKGLVTLRSGPADERVRRAELTPAGLAELEEMNRRSDQAAEAILSPLTELQRERLVAAMAEVHRLLQAAGARIERVDPTSPEAQWCLSQYFDELARRFEEGFDPDMSLPTDDAEMRPPRGTFLIASLDGEPVACGAVKPLSPGVGYIKRMWVADSVRGLGFGRRMLSALESHARELGFATLCLETNRALVEAIRLYESSGYQEVAPFNAEPYADHWFEKHLP